MEIDSSQFVHWFRQASPYIHAHRNKICVITFPGEAVEDEHFQHIIHDIALLHALGMKLVIVAGARHQINERLQLRNTQSQFHNGLRVTDLTTLASVKDAVGTVRVQMEAMLSMGLVNSPMHGAKIRTCSGNFVSAKPIGVIDGVDFQYTGEVRGIDKISVEKLLDDNNIVLLSPLGYSVTGEAFNLSSEQVARHAAVALKADKLICICQDALKKEADDSAQDKIIRELNPATARLHLENLGNRPENQQQDKSDVLLSLKEIIEAINRGVHRCHLISYRQEGSLLLELFTRDGCGTLITKDSFEQIHQASINDVGGILELITPLENEGLLVRRSRELLETEIEQFTVVERDGMTVACAALYPYPETGMGELACVAVHPDYRDGVRGNLLLEDIERQARSQGLHSLFVLTTRAAHWFQERGFKPADIRDLPQQKQSLYNFQRNSKVFVKAL